LNVIVPAASARTQHTLVHGKSGINAGWVDE
jgi:hypothetical protein